MDAGYRCVRFRARAWVVSWSRRLPVKVVGSAASFRYTREVGGVLPLCCAVLCFNASGMMDGGRGQNEW